MSNDYFVLSTRLLPGTKARAEDVNTKFDDVEDGFDKLPAPHATLTGFSDPIAAGDPTDKEHAVNVTTALGGGLEYAADTGAANAYVVDLYIAPASYRDGLTIRFKAANANTGACTVNVNSLGIKTLYRNTGAAMQSGDILAGTIITAIYNGNSFYCAAATDGQFNTLQAACEDAADSAAADAATVATDKGIVAADKAIVIADMNTVAADKDIVAADKATVAADKATTLGYKNDAETAADTAEGAVSTHAALDVADDVHGVQTTFNKYTSFKNRLLNGCIRIWQRATTQTVRGINSIDRWMFWWENSSQSVIRQSLSIGAFKDHQKYCIKTTVTSVAGAANMSVMQQQIEGVGTFHGETVTLSFLAKADTSKNIAIEFKQSFGTGGSPSAAVEGIGAQKIALTTAWTKYSVTVAIPSVYGKTLGTDGSDNLAVIFWFDAGSDYNSRTDSLGQQSGTYDITMIQLEKGDFATDFEQRPEGIELGLCQRYYFSINPYDAIAMRYQTAGAVFSKCCTISYPSTMRAVPAVTVLTAPTYDNCSGISFTGWDNKSAVGRVTVTAAGQYRAYNGVYEFDAEL